MTDRDDDVLAFFRKATGEDPKSKTAAHDETESESDDDEAYVLPPIRPDRYIAFRLGKRRERLLIDRASHPMRFPAYHALLDINFDQVHQEGFNLFFHAMTVEVTGKNLWPVVHAISNGRCAAIYEYHAKLYPTLPAKDEPLIDSIILMPPVALADD